MSFHLITGQQRSGKTCYLVDKIFRTLKHTNRYILTDISINRENLDKELGFESGDRLKLLGKVDRLRFLEHKEHTHTDIYIDEAYQLFPKMQIPGALTKEEQHQYFCYIMEHNKDHDNIFFICHDVSMLAPWVLAGVQSFIKVQHSHKINMFNMYILKGLSYPFQFFQISEYWTKTAFLSTTSQPDNVERLKPSAKHFKRYDSHSRSSGLQIVQAKKKAEKQEKFKKSYSPIFWKWAGSKGIILLCIITFFLFIIVGFGSFVKGMMQPKKPVQKIESGSSANVGIEEPVIIEKIEKVNEPKKGVDHPAEPQGGAVSTPVLVGSYRYSFTDLIVFENYQLILSDYQNIKIVKGELCIGLKSYPYAAISLLSVQELQILISAKK